MNDKVVSNRAVSLMEIEQGSLICKMNEVNFASIPVKGNDYRTILLLRYPQGRISPDVGKSLGQA